MTNEAIAESEAPANHRQQQTQFFMSLLDASSGEPATKEAGLKQANQKKEPVLGILDSSQEKSTEDALKKLSASPPLRLVLDQQNGIPFSKSSSQDIGLLSETAPPSEKQKWTIIIDAAVDFAVGDDYGYFGGERDINKLAALKELTKDKPVTIVAQTIDHSNPEFYKIKPSIYTIVIKDGEIKRYPERPSEGFGADLTYLLETATRQFPSEKVSLSLNSHGGGNEGLYAEETISLDELNGAISQGLNATGRLTLDLLEFDACLMAQTGVLKSEGKVAKTLIASPELEYNLSELPFLGIIQLIENPSLSAQDMQHKMIELSDEVSKSKELFHDPIISAFDLSKSAELGQSIDKLGNELANFIQTTENLDVVKSAIRATHLYGVHANVQVHYQHRDLKMFLNILQDYLSTPSHKEKDAELIKSIENVQEKLSETLATHVDGVYAAHQEQKLGGLSIFLPDLDDIKDYANYVNRAVFSDIGSLCDVNSATVPGLDWLARNWTKNALPKMSQLNQDLGIPMVDKNFGAAAAAISNYASTGLDESRTEFLDRRKNMCDTVDELRRKYTQVFEARIYQRELLRNQMGSELEPGWNNFVRQLANHEDLLPLVEELTLPKTDTNIRSRAKNSGAL